MELQKTNEVIKKSQEKWFIVFHDNSVKEISYTQAQQIFKLSGEPNHTGIKIDGGFYKFASFSKIISESEYYEQYPEKRPEYSNYSYDYHIPGNQLDRIAAPVKKTKRLSVLKKLHTGLLNYIKSNRYQGTDAPKKLLEMVKLRITTMSKGAE